MNRDDMSHIMNSLMAHRAELLPPKGLAEVFDRLIWCLDDNGESLLRIREEWLQSDDRDRVDVALAMDEVFPFKDENMMNRVFLRISSRWPDLAETCAHIRAARDEQHSRRGPP